MSFKCRREPCWIFPLTNMSTPSSHLQWPVQANSSCMGPFTSYTGEDNKKCPATAVTSHMWRIVDIMSNTSGKLGASSPDCLHPGRMRCGVWPIELESQCCWQMPRHLWAVSPGPESAGSVQCSEWNRQMYYRPMHWTSVSIMWIREPCKPMWHSIIYNINTCLNTIAYLETNSC